MIVIMQCEDGANIVLAVDTERKRLCGYCPKCRKLFDITDPELDDEAVENIEKTKHEVKRPTLDSMFYLRCTELPGVYEK